MQFMLPLLNMQAPPQSSKTQHHQLMRTVSISILVMSLPVLYVSFLHVPPAALFRDTTFWFLMSNSIIIVIAADSGMLFFGSSSSSCSVDADADDGLSFVVSGGEPTAAVKNGHVSDEVVLPVEVVNNQALVVREQGNLTVIAENDHAYALVVRDDHAEQPESKPESKEIMLSPSAGAGAGARPRLTASRSLAREERMARRRHSHRPSHYSHALVPVQDKSMVVSEEKQLRRTATEGQPSAAAAEEEERESELNRRVSEEEEYSRLSDEELNRRVEEFITRFNREIRLQLEKEQLALAAA